MLSYFMVVDETLMLLAASSAALAVLVYLMWRAATQKTWQDFTSGAKKEWRAEEAKRKK